MASGTQSRYLEMKYVARAVCYEVRIREDVNVQLMQFPDDEAILKLWNSITGCRLDYLRQSPSRPLGKFFLIAPEESTQKGHRKYFLRELEDLCGFVTSSFTEQNLAQAQRTLSRSPLYLVRYRRHDEPKEEFVTAERAAEILDFEFPDRVLLHDVLELQGTSLFRRTITSEERKMIADLVHAMG